MLQFNYTGNGYEVTGQVAPLETDIIIPSTFDDGVNGEFPVTSIEYEVFDNNQLTSVVIPNSVTSLGTNAFSNNSLTSVTIPSSVTSIGTLAFANNQLTSVVWETTMGIPSRVFSGTNNKITSFTITSDSLVSLANINAFSGVTTGQPMTVYVQPQLIEDYKIATNWVTLYNDGKATFEPIQITKLIPYLTAIKEAIQFKNGTTGNVNVQDMPQMIRDIPSGGGGGLEYLMRDSTPAGSKAILTQDGDGTLHAEIPQGVTSIGYYAFYYNQLTSVTIPNSVTSIKDEAFSRNSLTSVTIPNSVTSIKDEAFSRNSLTSVIIPNSVTSIGSGAFANNQLTSVIIPNSVTNDVGFNAFSDNQLTSVVWETTRQIKSYTFEGPSNNITSFTITSDTVISLANINAFSGVTTENPMSVYVQPQLIEDYKTRTNWVTLFNAGKCDFVDIALAPTE